MRPKNRLVAPVSWALHTRNQWLWKDFTKEIPYKIFAFTKNQFRITYIMGATYGKLRILERDLLRKSPIRFSFLLKARSIRSKS